MALLRPHLTRENHQRLLADARHKTKRDVEHQIACLAPKADVTTVLRKVPSVATTEAPALNLVALAEAAPPVVAVVVGAPQVMAPVAPSPRAALTPLAADRYVLKVTMLVADLERRRMAEVLRPRLEPISGSASRGGTRHVPAAMRRAVWRRDGGRCAFEGPHGRCRETGRLELHHVVPFARGGPTTVANLALRCRAHNAYEGDLAGLAPARHP